MVFEIICNIIVGGMCLFIIIFTVIGTIAAGLGFICKEKVELDDFQDEICKRSDENIKNSFRKD